MKMVVEFLNILRWPKTSPETGTDLDSHLQIPDNDSSTFHVYYPNPQHQTFYYATNTYTCGSCSSDQLSDNVTLDKDHNQYSTTASPPGDETITISKVRSGTYSFSVHNFTNMDNSSNYKTNLRQSRAKVKVFYNDQGTLVRKRYNVPNDNGTLWRVFTFDSSGSGSGFTRVDNMTYETRSSRVY